MPKTRVNIPQGAIPSERSGFRRFLRNTLAVPLAKLVGIDVKPDLGWTLDPNASPFQTVENAPENVKQALDQLLDLAVDKYISLSDQLPEITTENVDQIFPYIAPTAEEVSSYAPDLSGLSFEPIATEARKQFQQSTIPSIAERFAGAGGLNSSALVGQLGKAASDLEGKLAALRSQYGLEQAGMGIKGHEAATKRAGVLGQLGIGANASQLDRAKLLAQLQGQQASNVMGQQQNLMNILGLTTRRNTTLEPNQAIQQLQQHPSSQFDPYKALEIGGKIAGNIAPLFL
jgi:hypothetical protein